MLMADVHAASVMMSTQKTPKHKTQYIVSTNISSLSFPDTSPQMASFKAQRSSAFPWDQDRVSQE